MNAWLCVVFLSVGLTLVVDYFVYDGPPGW